MLVMTFVDRNTGKTGRIMARFKIRAKSKTDWVPIILGGMAIDCEARGGLGNKAPPRWRRGWRIWASKEPSAFSKGGQQSSSSALSGSTQPIAAQSRQA